MLIILGVLVLCSVLLHFIPKNKNTSVEKISLFQISDTSAVTKITINSKSLNNTLERTDDGWILNDKIKADENIIMVLLAVMKEVEILRKVPQRQVEEEGTSFDERGIDVRFYAGNDLLKSFVANANETKTLSIFKSRDGDYYVVNLPGYDSFVTGIFEIAEIDWKDRLIIDASPVRLQQLAVRYFDEPARGFTVDVKSNIPIISGVSDLDTLKLMDYLDQFQYFQADSYINISDEPRYDSLLKARPYVEFSFKNLGRIDEQTLTFYPKIEGENMILAVTSEGEHALFNYRRIGGIFQSKEFFTKRE